MGFEINNGILEKYIEEEGVTRAVVPEGVKDIHFHAFNYCKNLTSIHLPRTLDPEELYSLMLWGCDELTEITVDEDNPNFTSVGGVLYNKKMTALIRCPNGIDTERFVVPETVRFINDNAFRECYDLKEIIIPGRLEIIGFSAFESCSSLKHIEFGDRVDNGFNDNLFFGCHELEEISIPSGVSCICSNVFDYCDSLKKIRLGKDMSGVTSDSFTARNLEVIEVDPLNTKLSSKDGILYNKDMTTLLFCPYGKSGDIVIPDGVKQIGVSPDLPAFAYCDRVTSVHVPASVERIFDGAFENCPAKVTYEGRESIEFFHAERKYL